MNQDSIREGNVLIAEFMGAEYCEYPDGFFPGEFGYRFKDKIPADARDSTEGYWWNVTALSFHSSFDWIMPVVQKIGKLEFYKTNGMREYLSENWHDSNINIHSHISVFFNKAVAFIKWYNSQQVKQ